MDSDTEEDKQLPCASKLAFNTRKEALATANVARYRYGTKLKAYICRYCSLWHLASNFDDD